jgi:hypothetical protein
VGWPGEREWRAVGEAYETGELGVGGKFKVEP